jgi:hypothetical protein
MAVNTGTARLAFPAQGPDAAGFAVVGHAGLPHPGLSRFPRRSNLSASLTKYDREMPEAILCACEPLLKSGLTALRYD